MWLGIFVLRTWAVYERSWTVFLVLAVPTIANLAVNIVCTTLIFIFCRVHPISVGHCSAISDRPSSWAPDSTSHMQLLRFYFGTSWVRQCSALFFVISFTDCGQSKTIIFSFNSTNSELVDLVNITLSAIFDTLVVFLTVYRTWQLARQSKEAEISGSLSFLLLRDG